MLFCNVLHPNTYFGKVSLSLVLSSFFKRKEKSWKQTLTLLSYLVSRKDDVCPLKIPGKTDYDLPWGLLVSKVCNQCISLLAWEARSQLLKDGNCRNTKGKKEGSEGQNQDPGRVAPTAADSWARLGLKQTAERPEKDLRTEKRSPPPSVCLLVSVDRGRETYKALFSPFVFSSLDSRITESKEADE